MSEICRDHDQRRGRSAGDWVSEDVLTKVVSYKLCYMYKYNAVAMRHRARSSPQSAYDDERYAIDRIDLNLVRNSHS